MSADQNTDNCGWWISCERWHFTVFAMEYKWNVLDHRISRIECSRCITQICADYRCLCVVLNSFPQHFFLLIRCNNLLSDGKCPEVRSYFQENCPANRNYIGRDSNHWLHNHASYCCCRISHLFLVFYSVREQEKWNKEYWPAKWVGEKHCNHIIFVYHFCNWPAWSKICHYF